MHRKLKRRGEPFPKQHCKNEYRYIDRGAFLRQCSNNLNQYAKKANQTGSVYEADVQDLQERFNEFWSIGKELLARLSTIQ